MALAYLHLESIEVMLTGIKLEFYLLLHRNFNLKQEGKFQVYLTMLLYQK